MTVRSELTSLLQRPAEDNYGPQRPARGHSRPPEAIPGCPRPFPGRTSSNNLMEEEEEKSTSRQTNALSGMKKEFSIVLC